jgi:hypothetical protein
MTRQFSIGREFHHDLNAANIPGLELDIFSCLPVYIFPLSELGSLNRLNDMCIEKRCLLEILSTYIGISSPPVH